FRLKDTKSLGNNKAPACESRGFVLNKEGVLFDTPSFFCFSGYKSRGESVIPSFYTFVYHKQNNIFKSSFTETEYRHSSQ
ncbi:hypothetical protein, partial [Caecibacteroides pullorum]|uniref:hypothetical protein n=1 Tax=Caecibacteroides pullorum TaxID=2725562 RepID=UPI00195EB92C